jgi:GDP-mannose 6-dehydrogenase
VFGLGYVGSVSAAALARRGHAVVGVDVDESKVASVAAGQSPIVEPGLDDLIGDMVAAGSLSATTDAAAAVVASDASLVCVGTPSARGGEPDTTAIARVMETIGSALRGSSRPHVVITRSTILPGTSENLLIPILEEASGRSLGSGVGFVFNPEFLREGSSLHDFQRPPKTVFGVADDASADTAAAVYRPGPEPVFRVPIRVAELVKYADNAFHALKVGFANEIGAVSSALEIDSHEVMTIFKADDRLNISEAYLTPGFAFGGSCLPKDVRALAAMTTRHHVDAPILQHVLQSNDAHLQRAFDLVAQCDERRVGMFGLAFKSATDDLRESPFVELAERLIGKGYDLRIHDPVVSPNRLVGANKRYVQERLPHLSSLLVDDPRAVVEHGQVLVVGSRHPAVLDALAASEGRWIVDLVRLPDAAVRRGGDRYLGIAW